MTISQKVIYFFFIFVQFNLLANEIPKNYSANDCLKCHEQKISGHKFFKSSHKDITCQACHISTSDHFIKSKCAVPLKGVNCTSCHAAIVKEHQQSVHNSKRFPVACSNCHSDIHEIKNANKNKETIALKCLECHSNQNDYLQSEHHKAILKGKTDAATCTDCHGMHAIKKVDNEFKGREFNTKSCLQCHANKDLMIKNQVTMIAAETYFNSFHGKNVKLGYPEKVAGCADCHTSHRVLKANNPNSSIHKSNLVKTCSQCHTNASESFTNYIPHAEDHDKKKYPVLYWTQIFMNGLMIITFMFFWIHSILWAFRSFVENQDKKRAGILIKHKTNTKIYRRFRPIHVFLHLLVVVSFLALSLTGLPLKFNSTQWGKYLIDLLGGAPKAQFIHHTAAVITFIYFFIALVMSYKFLFLDKNQKGSFLNKLFGPDSLFFNKRDLSDVIKMFKWFFFKGPKPTFERWTYWEKFDFMAVFWGMFVIGSSGLMLWFPEFFGRFLPGWMFNLATIIHSDEALLATGFIFTVHFFNTHVRPEKFPMDTVIFNGEISHDEMLEERKDQFLRYEKEGKLDEYRIHKPTSVFVEFIIRVFGFVAVAIGIALVIGMISAML